MKRTPHVMLNDLEESDAAEQRNLSDGLETVICTGVHLNGLRLSGRVILVQ